MKLGNTSVRIIVSVMAIPLILFACVYGKIPFLIFVLGIGLLSFGVFTGLAKKKNIYPNSLLGFLTVALLILNVYFNFVQFDIIIISSAILILLSELFRNKSSAILNTGATFLGILYLGLFSASILAIREFYNYSVLVYDEGGYLIISIMASIWICDSAAFFIGSAIGKHKLFPRVSPNKSWEGAITGFVFSVIAMIAAKALILDNLTLFDTIIIGIIVGLIGQLGDLVESLFKRDAGVKDSSNLIPGHGGIFDRFDSLFLTAPTVYVYLFLFVGNK